LTIDTALLRILLSQHTPKVNSCDNNVKYSTSKIVNIIISNMNSGKN
jgi:hypothetical protein